MNATCRVASMLAADVVGSAACCAAGFRSDLCRRLGQSRSFGDVCSMYGLPAKAAVERVGEATGLLQGDRPANRWGGISSARSGSRARLHTKTETHWGHARRGPNVCAPAQCASGSVRTWMCTARGLEPLPPSFSHGGRSPFVL